MSYHSAVNDLDDQIRRAKIKRRSGYVFFGLLTAYLTVPMIVGAFSGVASGEIWDPYTHEHLSEQESTARWCFDEASRLIQEAGRLDTINRKWDEPAKQWTGQCRKDHPELQQVLVETRSQLRKRGKN